MRILVTVASRHGATREIGDRVATVLRRRGHEVCTDPPERVASVLGFDVVILGSAVYLSRWLKAATQLLDRCANDLPNRVVYLFSSGPVSHPLFPDTPPCDLAALITRSGARQHVVFAGRLDTTELAVAERIAVRMSHASAGDYRDWPAIEAWAEQIAVELAGLAPSVST